MNESQTALLNHIRDLNAKTQAWIDESPTTRGACMIVEDIEYWTSLDINTVEEFIKYDLMTAVYEYTKSLHGYKVPWTTLKAMTIEELQADMAQLEQYSAVRAAEERMEEIEDLFYKEQDKFDEWLNTVPPDLFEDAAEALGH